MLKPCFLGTSWASPTHEKQRLSLLFSFVSACSLCFWFIKLDTRGFSYHIFYPYFMRRVVIEGLVGIQTKSVHHREKISGHYFLYVCFLLWSFYPLFLSEKNDVECFQNISVFPLIFFQHLLTVAPCIETIMYSYCGHKNGKILCSASGQWHSQFRSLRWRTSRKVQPSI